MMQELSDQAIAKARANIANSFVDASSLDDLTMRSLQLEKELIAIESQLNGAVQGKLDSLKRAVDLMDESVNKLSKLSVNIQHIDDKIAMTNTVISNYSYVKNVHNARENLDKVIKQVDFFARVPQQVDELRKKLLEHPMHLKEVFLESLKQESLRVALINEMRVSRNRRMSIAATSESYASASSGGEYSEETYKKVRATVEEHLKIVPELVAEVRNIVFNNIDRMFDLANSNPEDLVTSFEIVLMQQEYNDRRNAALAKRRKNNSSNNNNNSARVEFENIANAVEKRIRRIFDEKVEGEFEMSYNTNNSAANGNFVDANGHSMKEKDAPSLAVLLIKASTQILMKIMEFREEVLPCIPGDFEALMMFIEAFEFFLTPKIQDVMRDLSVLKVSDILALIGWFETHKINMEFLGFPRLPSIEDFAQCNRELMVEYQERIKSQVHTWFENIKNRTVEITTAANNMLVTSQPEDMFNIIHAQLSVARERLPAEYVKEVGIKCLQLLQEYQRDAHHTLMKLYKENEVEAICAMVNDNQHMQEKCDEFGHELMKIIDHLIDDYRNNKDSNSSSSNQDSSDSLIELEKEQVAESLNEVSSQYLAIANTAVNYLAKSLVEVMDEAVFSRLYSADWELHEDVVSVLIVTLRDYFGDFKQWLQAYHFRKLIKELLPMVVGHYLMSIRRKANGTFALNSEITASKKIFADRILLLEFFTEYADYFDNNAAVSSDGNTNSKNYNLANVHPKLDKELEPMMNLLRIISQPQQLLETDCKSLFSKYGVDALKLVQAVILCQPGNKVNNNNNSLVTGLIDSAKRLFEQSGVAGKAYSNVANEDYAAYDIPLNGVLLNQEKANKSRGFWGRRK